MSRSHRRKRPNILFKSLQRKHKKLPDGKVIRWLVPEEKDRRVVIIGDDISRFAKLRKQEDMHYVDKMVLKKMAHWCESFYQVKLRPGGNWKAWQGVWLVDTLNSDKSTWKCYLDYNKDFIGMFGYLCNDEHSLPTVFVICGARLKYLTARIENLGQGKHLIIHLPYFFTYTDWHSLEWGKINSFLRNNGRQPIDWRN